MRVEANTTSQGSFVTAFVRSKELSILKPIFLLIDTGASISAISLIELGENVDPSQLKKKQETAIGIGGSIECFIISDVELYFISSEGKWIKAAFLPNISILPPIYDKAI